MASLIVITAYVIKHGTKRRTTTPTLTVLRLPDHVVPYLLHPVPASSKGWATGVTVESIWVEGLRSSAARESFTPGLLVSSLARSSRIGILCHTGFRLEGAWESTQYTGPILQYWGAKTITSMVMRVFEWQREQQRQATTPTARGRTTKMSARRNVSAL